jgi:hypothetical protein
MKKKKIQSDKKKRKRASSLQKSDNTNPVKNAGTDNSGSDGFDFGGIPDRDLKKNLGCG